MIIDARYLVMYSITALVMHTSVTHVTRLNLENKCFLRSLIYSLILWYICLYVSCLPYFLFACSVYHICNCIMLIEKVSNFIHLKEKDISFIDKTFPNTVFLSTEILYIWYFANVFLKMQL